MKAQRLTELLDSAPSARILVLGDFFLDRYLVVSPALAERSIETGLVAYQVTEVVAAPGAAGTVAANLRALGAQVQALGLVGDDGEGYELRRGLRALGAGDALVSAAGWHTPTYTKPIVRPAMGAPQELERLDIRTRAPAPCQAIDTLLERLAELAPQADAVVVADQMPEAEHGTITARVRGLLAELAEQHPATWFLADSRARIGEFRQVIAKPNLAECQRASGLADELPAARALQRRTGRPVFVTLGERGILVVSGDTAEYVPGVAVSGPIDVVGAGDSAMAAIAAGLCAGATLAEAAQLGNLAAAVTIQQLGTTGTASPDQIRALGCPSIELA